MVSIHRILIVLYMTIRVLCFVFRFKRGSLTLSPVPRLEALAFAHPVKNEQRRTHADEFI